jgi:hypothetical protein
MQRSGFLSGSLSADCWGISSYSLLTLQQPPPIWTNYDSHRSSDIWWLIRVRQQEAGRGGGGARGAKEFFISSKHIIVCVLYFCFSISQTKPAHSTPHRIIRDLVHTCIPHPSKYNQPTGLRQFVLVIIIVLCLHALKEIVSTQRSQLIIRIRKRSLPGMVRNCKKCHLLLKG